MKFYCKRLLLGLFLAISIAAMIGVIASMLSESVLKLPDFWLDEMYVLLLVLLIFTRVFVGKYGEERKRTKEFFYENHSLLDQTLRDLSGRPIVRIATNPAVKLASAPNSIRINGLYILPDVAASEEDIADAAAVTETLYGELRRKEAESYPDYAENTLNFCICKKGLRVWAVQIKSAAFGTKQTLFFSPDGKTRELNGAAFFPPKRIADGWFV